METANIIFLTTLLSLVGIYISAIEANPVPPDADQQEGKSVSEVHHAYTESNITYSTLEEILEEIKAKEEVEGLEENIQPEHDIHKRYEIFCTNI